MTRKLLPYEHQLIDALGISEEDYLEFVAAQPIYEDCKEGTIVDVRADFGVVALVFTIVGTLTQVAAALLAPRPKAPEAPSVAPSQDQRVLPRFGFNGTQELAAYGTSIPLVYTNTEHNSRGGVRVNTSLVWSAILSYGGNQFMRLLLNVGAGEIEQIDPNRIAIGQLPLRDYAQSNIWAYWKPNNFPRFNDLLNIGNIAQDPTNDGSKWRASASLSPFRNGRAAYGFSQALSPTTNASSSITGVIPVNVDFGYVINEGRRRRDYVGTYIEGAPSWAGKRAFRGQTLRLVIADTIEDASYSPRKQARNKARYAEASVVFLGARFKLGGAIFRVSRIDGASLDEGSIFVDFVCEEDGRYPTTGYQTTFWRDPGENDIQRKMFYTKCFAQIEEVYYATTTQCQSVEFALKLSAYRKLSGRASVYGRDQNDLGYNESENGGVMRSSLHRIYWRFAGEGGSSQWTKVRRIFVIRSSTEQSIFTYVKFIRGNANFSAPGAASYWEFKIVPVTDPSAEDDVDGYCYFSANGNQQTIDAGNNVRLQFNGDVYGYSQAPPLQKNPPDIYEWDLWNYDNTSQSQFSFEQGPELTITAVNEQLLEPWSSYGQLHRNMATLGLHALATTTTKDLRSVSVWVERGKKVRNLSTSPADYQTENQVNALVNSKPTSSSSFASDIFLDTILDDENGIGKYASIHSVDVVQLSKSKRFCKTNQLFMDGVIADQRSWREFWTRTAPLCLLELAKIGGRDTLIPGVPYDASTGHISVSPLPISALFTAGNILEDSYKEEFIDYGANVQDVIVTVVFRDTELNDIFPRNSTVEVRLSDTGDNDALRETIDASQYVTNRAQAILLGKFLCLSKRYFRRSIEFKTFPTDSPVAPGSYIYVEIGLNKWNSIYSGRIEEGGKLNAPLPQEVPNGDYVVFIYNPGQSVISRTTTVHDGIGTGLAKHEGALFALGKTVKNKRVFRVTEVELDEEGETTVRAIEHPTNDDGSSIIGKKLVQSGNFFVDNVAA